MKEKFIEKKFRPDSQRMIATIEGILDEYQRQGFDLSLRQLYYQLVARDVIENSVQSYKRIGDLVSDARLAGLLDWDMIVDRGRVTVQPSHWGSPADILDSAAYSFRIDKWQNQPTYVMVMVEKQALEGVLIPVCRRLDIPFMANKGYSSSSALYHTGLKLRTQIDDGKGITILYLGDHDPSGVDMTRDVRDRLNQFALSDFLEVNVDRLALNYDQVEALQPPPNPAKETDSRFEAYAREFGETCWELDAIEPNQLATIVDEAVGRYRDEDAWNEDIEREKEMRMELQQMAIEYRDKHG